jgi:hypothetical protein
VAKLMESRKSQYKNDSDLVNQMKSKLGDRPMINPRKITRPAELPAELVFESGTKVATRKATQAWFEWLMKQMLSFMLGLEI